MNHMAIVPDTQNYVTVLFLSHISSKYPFRASVKILGRRRYLKF